MHVFYFSADQKRDKDDREKMSKQEYVVNSPAEKAEKDGEDTGSYVIVPSLVGTHRKLSGISMNERVGARNLNMITR